jgi:hypothetical protein
MYVCVQVKFSTAAAAAAAVVDANPTIEGRRANCNLAHIGAKRTPLSTGYIVHGLVFSRLVSPTDRASQWKPQSWTVRRLGPGRMESWLSQLWYGHDGPWCTAPARTRPQRICAHGLPAPGTHDVVSGHVSSNAVWCTNDAGHVWSHGPSARR